jgi:hypothetical protein
MPSSSSLFVEFYRYISLQTADIVQLYYADTQGDKILNLHIFLSWLVLKGVYI